MNRPQQPREASACARIERQAQNDSVIFSNTTPSASKNSRRDVQIFSPRLCLALARMFLSVYFLSRADRRCLLHGSVCVRALAAGFLRCMSSKFHALFLLPLLITTYFSMGASRS